MTLKKPSLHNNLADALFEFFDSLHSKGIDYIVLRNYDELNQKRISHLNDIDILIKPSGFSTIKNLSSEIFHEFFIIEYYLLNSVLLRVVDISNSKNLDLHFYYRPVSNADLFYTDKLFKEKYLQNCFFAFPKHIQQLLEYFHRIYEKKGKLKKTYSFNNPLATLSKYSKLSKSKNNKILKLNSLDARTRQRKVKASHILAPITYINYFKSKIINWRKGKIIALVGVDGVGKSTIINEIKNIIPGTISIYMGSAHYRFQKFYDILPKNFITNFILFFMVYLENWIRYIQSIWLKSIGYTVIFDRFPTYQFARAKGFRKILYSTFYNYFFPSPYQIFYLYNESEILMKRKKEHSQNQLEEIQYEYNKISTGKRNTQSIKNDDMGKTIQKIIAITYGK